MKVAFFVGRFPALSETFILNQITGLIERGYDVDIYANSAREEKKQHPDVQKYNELEFQDKQLRRLQRKMDRSRRATNPGNYSCHGTVKKGKKQWNKSKSYLKTRSAKANLERKLAAQRAGVRLASLTRMLRKRKSLHGELVNDILRNGNVIKLEKLSYKSFQKLFGKSVARRAPGMFVSHLKNKAGRAGGQVVEIPTYSTLLSQTCQCGRVKKKALKERVHNCVCGVQMPRDLYSALLAKHIDSDTFVLQVSQLIDDWQSAELRLKAAWRTATQKKPATGRTLPSSCRAKTRARFANGRCLEVERVAAEVFKKTSKSQDVVAVTREPGRGCWTKKPPGF